MKVTPPSSGLKSMPTKADSRHCLLPVFTRLFGVISLKIEVFLAKAVGTPNHVNFKRDFQKKSTEVYHQYYYMAVAKSKEANRH
jgi:hypothetical protein